MRVMLHAIFTESERRCASCKVRISAAPLQVDETDQAMSTWCLRASQFGRDWELVWFARNMAPIRYAPVAHEQLL